VGLTYYDANGHLFASQQLQLPRYGMLPAVAIVSATRIDSSVESGGGSVIGIATIAAANGESGATILSRAVNERVAGASVARAMWKTALDTNPVNITTVVPVLSA